MSPGLESIILKALDKEPERRYQTAHDLRAALERLTAGIPAVVVARPKRVARRWLLAAGTLGVLVAALLGLNVGRWRIGC